MSGFPWNDSLDLQSIEQSFVDVSPLFILWQFHLQKASGEISIQVPQYTFEVLIGEGKIQGVRGVPQVLSSLGIENLPGASLEDLIGIAMGKGLQFGEVLKHAAQNIGLCLVKTSYISGGHTRSSTKGVGRPMDLPLSIPAIIEHGVNHARSENELMREYASKMRKRVVKMELDLNPARLSLPMDVLKMFRKISSGQRLGELVPNAAQVTMEWRYIDLLSTIQLISFQDVKKKIQRVANEKSLQQYQELKEVLQQYQEMDPHMIYTLEAPNEINDITIDQRFRNLSKSYHPDRFIGSDKKIIGIVEEIYTLINDTHSLLQDESLREILRLRLDAEQRGEQYVGPEDSQKSELLYAQAQFLFRKRKYEDVKGVLEKAFSLNPYNWRVQTLQARVKAALGEAGKKESAEILLSIKEAKGRDRVELLFNAAELLFAAEEKERAYELFQTVVDVDDSHIDAKRYLQRRAVEKRKEKSPSSKKGFFGGLFSKKK